MNKVCLSGLSAIAMADQMIRAGELEIAVAGGMESMTNAPYLIPKARDGSRMGDAALVDSMIHDGLWSTLPRSPHGRGDRHRQRANSGIAARGAGRVVRTLASAGGRGMGRRAAAPTRSCRSRCRSARAIR